MLIGADTAGRLLEVGAAAAKGIEFIVHAMPAGPAAMALHWMPHPISEGGPVASGSPAVIGWSDVD